MMELTYADAKQQVDRCWEAYKKALDENQYEKAQYWLHHFYILLEFIDQHPDNPLNSQGRS